MAHVQHSTVIPVNKNELFAFLSDYRKRPRIMPSDLILELTSLPIEMKKGAEYDFKLTRWGLSYNFILIVESVEPLNKFVERSQFGFFEEWVHTCKLEEHGENSTLLTSIIDYKMPLGILGTLADDLFIRSDLRRTLEYAHNKLKSLFD